MSDTRPDFLTAAGALPARLPPAEELARLWEQKTQADVNQFLKNIGPLSASELAGLLHVDQHHRWRAGERLSVESYLQRFPELSQDRDALVDVIFHEYLIRQQLGEQPQAREYADRFPLHAEALQNQIAFHQLLHDSDVPLAGPISPGSTLSNPADGAAETGLSEQSRIGFIARGGQSSNRDLQYLLKQRLRLVSGLSCVAYLLYIPVLWTLFSVSWGTALYAALLAETALIALLLSSRRSFTLRALRWVEACLFCGLLLYFGYQQVQFFQIGFFSTLAVGTWIGPIVAARSMSWPVAVTMITYGILIPNTARRCVMAVMAMAFGFLAITLGLALTSAGVPHGALAGYVLCSITDMTFAGVIAVFGAYRIATLDRAVSEAKKLGPYRLIRRLGSGGMGEVYLAEHALLRRPCALKLIRPERAGDALSLSRFEREVQAMATLTHPNTVRIYDYGLAADGTFYYAMEFLPGLSLQELVTRYGPLPPERVVYLLRQVCGALREAHDIGLVHRDIKPANVIACQAGGMYDVAKLLDFGLVRVHGHATEDNCLTGAGTIAGTPAFMSPEQAASASDVDARSDIYSLGAVAYFLLTGRPPFVEPTPVQTMAAHLATEVISPREHQLCIPADVEALVLRCLHKDRTQRFPDVDSLVDALSSTHCANNWSSDAADGWWCAIERTELPPRIEQFSD